MSADGYAVDHASATTVVTSASAAIGGLDDVTTALTTGLSTARGALPIIFGTAGKQLDTISEEHAGVVAEVKTYADSCVTAVEACLAEYENATAEMVADQRTTESKLRFQHAGAAETLINSWVNETYTDPFEDAMPSRKPPGMSGGYTETVSGSGTTTKIYATIRDGVVSSSATTTETHREGADRTTYERQSVSTDSRPGLTITSLDMTTETISYDSPSPYATEAGAAQ